jgi:hypothetical protein
MSTEAPRGAPPRKPGTSGWVIALLIVGGCLLFFCFLGGAGIFAFSRSDSGKKIFEAIGEGKEAYESGKTAPGAEAVRAAGCKEALVLDTGKVLGIMRKFVDAGEEVGSSKIVLCQGSFMDELPSCDEVAAAYVTSFGAAAPEPFVVTVQRQASKKDNCERVYSASGEPLGPLKR